MRGEGTYSFLGPNLSLWSREYLPLTHPMPPTKGHSQSSSLIIPVEFRCLFRKTVNCYSRGE